MTLIELYQWQGRDSQDGKAARALLEQTHWFAFNVSFDPKTGEALSKELSAFLANLSRPAVAGPMQDRLWRIKEHARLSVERLLRGLNESPRREQALLPVRAVRELDANSFIKLSNRPGRNIREKLAGKPYLHAVRRFQSVDIPENRLLKAFVTHLAELLEAREDYLGEVEDELLPKIRSWLLSDEAYEIKGWDNLPPNNTLLSHRDYRRVWDAWRWLQTIDNDIARDFSRFEIRAGTMRVWNDHARKWAESGYLFAEMPVLFDYDKFEIHPWISPPAFKKAPRKINRAFSARETSEPVCVDLTVLRPRFATATKSFQALPDTYLWQNWKRDDESVDIELFNSDAVLLSPEATSISSADFFFSEDNTSEHFARAARAFAARLREEFRNDTLIWLVPDSLNDFELEIARRNLNSRFPDAKPLPRSVAAVFARVDYSEIKHDGFSVVVVDGAGGPICVTKLLAKFDKELKKRLPETGGFYWERCPPVIVKSADRESVESKGYDILSVDDKGRWHDEVPPERPSDIDLTTLKRDPRIGQFHASISVAKSPVAGGIRLHSLQQRAGDIPLWRDQIPELSVKVMREGRYRRFKLVSRGKTVKPIRGLAVEIAVDEDFALPAGRPFYQFPLFKGENADELGFSARLDSPVFPLKESVVCKLKLTFEYGADEPYKLVFYSKNNSFPPVRAAWRKTEEVIVTNAPAPGYPAPLTWADLERMPRQHGRGTQDLLEWVGDAIARLDGDLYLRPRERTVGVVGDAWRVDRNGYQFTNAYCGETAEPVFIHERNFLNGFSCLDFEQNDELSFELQERDGRLFGLKIARPDYKQPILLKTFDETATEDIVARIRKRLYFPTIQIWRDGRSINDQECPKAFAEAMRASITYLSELRNENRIPKSIMSEILFLLSCMHKDAGTECIQWITEQVRFGEIRDSMAVGFALGDLSEGWQQHLFGLLGSKPNSMTISVFAYAIWREQHFVERFSISALVAILNTLWQRLSNIHSAKIRDRRIIRSVAEPLELLLGLLRTRASSDSQIRMLLQPHQKITKELAKQVERVTEILAQSHVSFTSRVQINIRKPDGDRTPDLLYALSLYLTGDDGANAIHINSVSDSDND